jgi:L-ascorbate metabolism protein UlaG (beta-lactamase superfamily)
MRIFAGGAVLGLAAVGSLWASSSGFASFGGVMSGARLERARRSPNFRDGKFVNSVPSDLLEPGSFLPGVRRQLFGDELRVPEQPTPIVRRAAADFETAPPLRVTWIGHASTLIEIDGCRVLTDPIWSERASPSTWVGPVRFHPPPIALEELPPIDAVVISHDHYDHLDMATATSLAARGTRFVVPLGIGAHLEAWNIAPDQITDLDWHERAEIRGLTFVALPARHYSGRNPLRADETFWASWAILGPTRRVFFSGDSGYFEEFAKTGETYGPFDVALVKIGASDETWVDIHMRPEDAARTAADVRARLFIPVHWGTFNLGYHAWNEPPMRAIAAAKTASIAIVVPRPGEHVDAAAPPKLIEWWR